MAVLISTKISYIDLQFNSTGVGIGIEYLGGQGVYVFPEVNPLEITGLVYFSWINAMERALFGMSLKLSRDFSSSTPWDWRLIRLEMIIRLFFTQ